MFDLQTQINYEPTWYVRTTSKCKWKHILALRKTCLNLAKKDVDVKLRLIELNKFTLFERTELPVINS